MNQLDELYKIYTEEVSTPAAAISLETAKYLWNLCEEKQPKILVDTGSGFSSFVFRLWSKDKDVTVYSFDDSDLWIKKSIEFSDINHVSTENFILWNDNLEIKNVDILLHDLGNMTTRASALSQIYSMMNTTGTIILDDLHKSDYDSKAKIFFKERSYQIKKITETIDSYGRFVGTVDLGKKQ